jgi:hypothetical protein
VSAMVEFVIPVWPKFPPMKHMVLSLGGWVICEEEP